MKKILLTGGNGFIGKNIRESFLASNYNIVAPGRQELNLTDSDHVDAYFCSHHFDVVIHCATKPGHRNAADISNLFYSNVRMYQNLVRHQDKYNKFILIGSGAIYDMAHYAPKMNESFYGQHIPADEHGFSKYIIYNDLQNRPNFVDLRLFGIFGKYEDYSIRFISNLICKSIVDLPLTMKQNRRFDYIYIDDLMPILDYFINETPSYSAYNITPNHAIELVELAKIINEISGKNLPIHIAEPGMGLEYSGDNARLLTEYKDCRFTKIDKSINYLYSYYLHKQQQINIELLKYDK